MKLKNLLIANTGGVWGDDADGVADTPVLRSTEQTVDGKWRIEEPAVRKLTPTERRNARLRQGDLLVTKSSGSSAHIGKTTLVTADIETMNCCYSNFMQRLRTSAELEPKYAWYLLNSELVRGQFDYLSSSTTGLANLNASVLGSITLPYVPPARQRLLIDFLDRETVQIDELIGKQNALIELLGERRKAMIAQAVTKGLDPDSAMKNSGSQWLGEVPTHWVVSPIKWVASLTTGITPPSADLANYSDETDGFPWLRPEDLDETRRVGRRSLQNT